jgi:hypothetical protein
MGTAYRMLLVYLLYQSKLALNRLSKKATSIPVSDGSVIGTALPSVYPTVRKFMFGLNLTF